MVKEIQNSCTGFNIQIEGAVDKFETPASPADKPVECREQTVQVETPHLLLP